MALFASESIPYSSSLCSSPVEDRLFVSSRLLGLVVKSVPGIIIVGREQMPGLETADEVVMAVEVQVAADLNEPGATAGATGHSAGNGDHRTTPMLPGGPGVTLSGLSVLAIEMID